MRYVFYITNHGFGHAARNVPVIRTLLREDSSGTVAVKTDAVRAAFLRRNSGMTDSRICYYEDIHEPGLILKEGEMLPDLIATKQRIEEDLKHWNAYIESEIRFLSDFKADIVVSDIVPWPLMAAHRCGIKSVLVSNFDWAEMYGSYYGSDICKPYLACYRLADKAVWYALHDTALHQHCSNYECVSLAARKPSGTETEKIRRAHRQPIVFVSLGASAALGHPIDVDALPYDFIATRGVRLCGRNVYMLPEDAVNTADYIAASEYVIAKGGWSTVAETLLCQKRCALLFRGSNAEDDSCKKMLEAGGYCIAVEASNLNDMSDVLDKLSHLKPGVYEMYRDDTEQVCGIIRETASRKGEKP